VWVDASAHKTTDYFCVYNPELEGHKQGKTERQKEVTFFKILQQEVTTKAETLACLSLC
jgi:hypothetical protein